MNSSLTILSVAAILLQCFVTIDGLQTTILHSKVHDTRDICTHRDNWALVPHPNDCRKFYVCANYIPEEYSCGQNHHFDSKTRMCVAGECQGVNECHERIRPVTGNCAAFEICEGNGVYRREECMPGYFFHSGLGFCVSPKDAEADFLCGCHLEDHSIFANSHDCRSFHRCFKGKSELMSCPQGYYFNKDVVACLIDLIGVCTAPPPMTAEEIAMLEVCKRTDRSKAAAIFHADDKTCDKFYICIGNRVVTKQCPKGFYFDTESRYCQLDTWDTCEAKKKLQQQLNEGSSNSEHKFQIGKRPVKVSVSLSHGKIEVEQKKEIQHKHHHDEKPISNTEHHKHEEHKKHQPLMHMTVEQQIHEHSDPHENHESHKPQHVEEQTVSEDQKDSTKEHMMSLGHILPLLMHGVEKENKLIDTSLVQNKPQDNQENPQPTDAKNQQHITSDAQHNHEKPSEKLENAIAEVIANIQVNQDQNNESHKDESLIEEHLLLTGSGGLPTNENLQQQLKLPENPKYDKLSSKFVSV